LKNTGGQQGGEFVFFLKQGAQLENLSQIESQKQREYERLKKMQQQADIAKRKEVQEIANKEKELAELDRKIEAMNKRLGTSEVRTDDSLDMMLAMVKQKEDQAQKLELLRQQKEEEQRKREAEIARLKKEREAKIIAALKPEVEKYYQIIASKYGESLKKSAWQALISKCPPGWADGVEDGDSMSLTKSPAQRIELARLKLQREEEERRKANRKAEVEFIKGYGHDYSDNSNVCFYSNNSVFEMSDDPRRCSTSWRAPNAVWNGNYKIDGNELILELENIRSPYPPSHTLGIGYTVKIKNAVFEDGSNEKSFILYKFQSSPRKKYIQKKILLRKS